MIGVKIAQKQAADLRAFIGIFEYLKDSANIQSIKAGLDQIDAASADALTKGEALDVKRAEVEALAKSVADIAAVNEAKAAEVDAKLAEAEALRVAAADEKEITAAKFDEIVATEANTKERSAAITLREQAFEIEKTNAIGELEALKSDALTAKNEADLEYQQAVALRTEYEAKVAQIKAALGQ